MPTRPPSGAALAVLRVESCQQTEGVRLLAADGDDQGNDGDDELSHADQ